MTYISLIILLLIIIYYVITQYKNKQAIFLHELAAIMRQDNQALNYLLENYKSVRSTMNRKIRFIIKSLPTIGDLLYTLAENIASDLSSLSDTKPYVNTLTKMTLSAFDLCLVTYFNEIFDFLKHENAVSSLLVDALLFQATGFNPTSVTEEEVMKDDTYKARGIQKFLLQRQILKHSNSVVGKDPECWLFGKEIACILSGGPDISIVLAVHTPSLLLRYDAKSVVRKILYNEKPIKSDRRKFETDLMNVGKTFQSRL